MTIALIIAFVNLNVVLGHVHWFIGFSFLFWNRERLLNRENAKDAKGFVFKKRTSNPGRLWRRRRRVNVQHPSASQARALRAGRIMVRLRRFNFIKEMSAS